MTSSASLAACSSRSIGTIRALTPGTRKGVNMSHDKISPQYSISAPTAGALGLALVAASGCAPATSSPIATQAATAPPRVDDGAIRPFQFHAADEVLVDLRRRIAATKWASPETVADASQGVQLATMRELARYWQTDYDWRKVEARLNALPQFVTNI